MNSNHQLTIDEIVELRHISLSYSFDAFEVQTKFRDLDSEALNYFKKRILESGRYKPSDSLLNAIVHRDYTNPTDVIIKIFDNRIEISNPGSFPLGISIEDIYTDTYQSKHRNKLLAEAFYLTGDIEKYGTGFIRLREWLKEYPNLKMKINDLSGFIRTELIAMKNVPVNVPVNDRQKKIIKDIQLNKYVTQIELAKKYNVNRETIKRDLKKLRELNLIKRVGSDKTGYWEVINNILYPVK